MLDILQFDFMRNALIAGVLAGVTCGVIGTFVVVNRIVFLSGGIAHAAYGGIGLAAYLGLPYMAGTVGFAVLAAMVMAGVTLRVRERSDTIVGVIWAAGMALGIILLDLTPGYNVDLMSYLFGSILTVPKADLWIMFGLNAAIILCVAFYFNGFAALSYDSEYARVRGAPVTALYLLLLCMIAVSVVMVIRVVGLILVIALLTIAPHIAEQYTRSLVSMMVLSSIFNIVFVIVGLFISYTFDLTSGAAIIMVSAVCFFISLLIGQVKMKSVSDTADGDSS